MLNFFSGCYLHLFFSNSQIIIQSGINGQRSQRHQSRILFDATTSADFFLFSRQHQIFSLGVLLSVLVNKQKSSPFVLFERRVMFRPRGGKTYTYTDFNFPDNVEKDSLSQFSMLIIKKSWPCSSIQHLGTVT